MIDRKGFRELIKNNMGPVFVANGFKYKYEGKNSVWYKPIEGGEYFIAIGLAIDTRIKNQPEFRMHIMIDPLDVFDARAYHHSGWPPKNVMKELGIKPTWFSKFSSFGYDAWIPFPTVTDVKIDVWQEYAEHLLAETYKRIPKAKKWTNKTHRWEYIERDKK